MSVYGADEMTPSVTRPHHTCPSECQYHAVRHGDSIGAVVSFDRFAAIVIPKTRAYGITRDFEISPLRSFETSDDAAHLGVTVGADVVSAIADRLGVVIPLRVTITERGLVEHSYEIANWNVRAGVGLLYSFSRRFH